jgi:hypothetical protein
VTISDLKRINQQIEKDTTKKTALELGEEQFENFGKENMEKIKGKIEREEDRKSANKTPSIYDLMKIKQEKDKRIVGKDIEIAKEEPKNPERDYGLGGFE